MAGTITDLTVRELGEIAREIGADPMQAVAEGTEHRWTALALCLWALDRRTDPGLAKDGYLELTMTEIEARYGEAEAEADQSEAPTTPEPLPS